MEQYAGDGTDLEGLLTIIKIALRQLIMVALTPTLRIDLRKGS